MSSVALGLLLPTAVTVPAVADTGQLPGLNQAAAIAWMACEKITLGSGNGVFGTNLK